MERTKAKTESQGADISIQEIRWKKIGGGSFYLGNRIIKPGQVFKAALKDIPPQFRDVCIPVDGLPEVVGKQIKGSKPVFTKVPNAEEEDMFDVVNAKGKRINDVALSEERADQLIKDMQA
jgi:hypothetical protein